MWWKLILTALFELLAYITSFLAGVIPSFPAGFDNVVEQFRSAITSGASIVLYFFDVEYIKSLLGMVLGYWFAVRVYNLVVKLLSRLHVLSGSEDAES